MFYLKYLIVVIIIIILIIFVTTNLQKEKYRDILSELQYFSNVVENCNLNCNNIDHKKNTLQWCYCWLNKKNSAGVYTNTLHFSPNNQEFYPITFDLGITQDQNGNNIYQMQTNGLIANDVCPSIGPDWIPNPDFGGIGCLLNSKDTSIQSLQKLFLDFLKTLNYGKSNGYVYPVNENGNQCLFPGGKQQQILFSDLTVRISDLSQDDDIYMLVMSSGTIRV